MLVLFFGAGISFIFLCGRFLCYLKYMLKKKNKS